VRGTQIFRSSNREVRGVLGCVESEVAARAVVCKCSLNACLHAVVEVAHVAAQEVICSRDSPEQTSAQPV